MQTGRLDRGHQRCQAIPDQHALDMLVSSSTLPAWLDGQPAHTLRHSAAAVQVPCLTRLPLACLMHAAGMLHACRLLYSGADAAHGTAGCGRPCRHRCKDSKASCNTSAALPVHRHPADGRPHRPVLVSPGEAPSSCAMAGQAASAEEIRYCLSRRCSALNASSIGYGAMIAPILGSARTSADFAAWTLISPARLRDSL